MRNSLILGIIFLILSSFVMGDLAVAQENSTTDEAQLFTQIELIDNKSNESPLEMLKKLNAIIATCKKNNWQQACLYASTLKVESLLSTTDINEAEKLLKPLMTLANKLNKPTILIRLELVDLNIKDSKGLFEGIPELQSRLLEKASTVASPQLAGEIYHDVGDSLYQSLDYTGALLSLNQAYESYQLANDLSAVGRVLNTLANINNSLGNTDVALEYLQKSLAISYELNNKFGSSIVLFNMSYSYLNSDNIKEARNHMQQAMQLSIELNDDIGIAWAKKELASYDIQEKNWQNAIALYTEIEPIFIQSGSALPLFETLKGQALAYLALNELDLAKQKADQCRRILKNLKDPIYQIALHKIDADIAYAKKDFQQAFDILAENYTFANDVRSEEKQKEIEKQLIRFSSKLKEKENQALVTENKLKNLQINQQAAQQKLWWLVIGFGILLLLAVGFMLFIQTRNRNHFKSMALNDHLTNSPNRRAILEYAELRFQESIRTQQTLTIGIIDIDNFKKLNDKYGHKVGDDVLVAFATACKNTIRQYDKFGRYGGEEWLFVFANTTPAEISAIFTRIRDELHKIIQQRQHDFSNVTFSMGVATYHQDTDKTLHNLINRADQNLYKAKALGKDQIVF